MVLCGVRESRCRLCAGVAVTGVAPLPPRIVAAAMQDADRDFRADSVRLTYSQPIRHARDRDRVYPFAVSGYVVRSVGAASGRALVVTLVEKGSADPRHETVGPLPADPLEAGQEQGRQAGRRADVPGDARARRTRRPCPADDHPTTTVPLADVDTDGDGTSTRRTARRATRRSIRARPTCPT